MISGNKHGRQDVRIFVQTILVCLSLMIGDHAIAAELPGMDCIIEPWEVVEVSSPVIGVIENILVERNDLVKKGQILAELQAEVEKAELAYAHVNASIDAEIKLQSAANDFNQRSQHRVDELYEKRAIPLHLQDETETDAIKSHWQVLLAKNKKQLAELELVRAKAVVKRKQVRSPIDGVVIARHRAAGEYIDDQSIVTVAQLNPLRVEIVAPLDMFGTVVAGMPAKITTELANMGTYDAMVISVDRVIDGASGTFDIRLELPNPDYQIPSGLNCQAILQKDEKRLPVQSDEESDIKDSLISQNKSSDTDISQSLESEAPESRSPKTVGMHGAFCRSLGPFASDEQTKLISSELEKLDSHVTLTRHTEMVIDSYTISGRSRPLPVKLETLHTELRQNGIDHFYIRREGQQQGRIIFGNYKGPILAEQRRLKLQELGYQTDLRPQRQAKTWINVETELADITELNLLNAVARVEPKSDVTISSCDQSIAANVDP